MAAADHLQPEQLRMFMTAGELHGMQSVDVRRPGSENGYGGHWPTAAKMWAVKRKENKVDGLDRHVAESGVHTPVTIAHQSAEGPLLSDGHHRVDAAYRADPNSLVPVEHEDWDKPVGERLRNRINAPQDVPGWSPTNRFPSVP